MDYWLVNGLLTVVVVLLTYSIFAIHYQFFTKPRSILKKLRAQGVKGYPFVPFLGQLPEIIKLRKRRDSDPAFAAATHGAEFFLQVHEKYGRLASFCIGSNVRFSVSDPAMARQAYVMLGDVLPKGDFLRSLRLLSGGLLTSNGEQWTWQRRLINPAFSHKQIKRIFPTMVQCSEDSLAKVESAVKANPNDPVNVDIVFSTLTLDIICRSAFGSQIDSIFGPDLLNTLMTAFIEYLYTVVKVLQFSGVLPIFKYLPFELNRRLWKVEAIIRDAMDKIISVRVEDHRKRTEAKAQQKAEGGDVSEEDEEQATDLLELMMNSTEGLETDPGTNHSSAQENAAASGTESRVRASRKLSVHLLKANCITFLLAGHETTGNLLSWTTLLLSRHPEWQEKARDEVNELYAKNGGRTPTFEQLNDLKIVGWILNESMRLFPPVCVIGRTAVEDTKLGDVIVPKDADIFIPIAHIHRKKEFWGEDADEFRPDRFANGISKAASNPNAFIPFSLGPRVCIGQNFALAEAKIILAMFLRKFSWRTSPAYQHYPDLSITLRPKKGMHMELKILQN